MLERRGLTIVDRNRRIGSDEIDLVAVDRGRTVAVEVKTRVAADPVDAFSPAKAHRLRRAARSLGRGVRCDLVTVRLDADGAVIRWITGV